MEEEKKDKINIKGIIIFIIILIIIVISSLFLLQEENQIKITEILKSFDNKEKELELVNSFNIDEDVLDVNIYEDTIIKWEKNKLSLLNIDGTEKIDKEFEFVEPSIFYGKNHIYIMDKSTGEIILLDKEGKTIDKLNIEKEIFNLEEINGNLIYQWKSSEEEKNIENINILDKDRVESAHYSYNNNNILTYTVNKDVTKKAIGTIDINEKEIISNIEFYDEKNEETYSIDIKGEIIVYLYITSDGELVALTDNSIHFIKDGEILWEKELNLIKDIYLKDKDIYILYSNYLEIIDFKGNIKEKIGFTGEYDNIMPFKETTLVYDHQNMIIIKNGEKILKKELAIKKIRVNDDKILIWEEEEIKVFELNNKI